MFNNTQISSNTIINGAVTGIIQKSNRQSFFVRFHLKSDMAKEILNNKPVYYDKNNNSIEVSVLQVLLLNDNEFLVELVNIEFL